MAGVNSQYYQQPSWQAQGQAAYNQPGTAHSQYPGYHGVYQDPGQLQQQGRPPTQPGPQTCYNCGSPDHWAQNCPEPRRAVPAGSLNRPNNPRPNKRHKVNGPIVTRYPVPPHMAMHQAPPQAYGGSPYSKPGFHQQNPHYGPPTPVSAYPAPNHQWPQAQQQHYNPAYSQGYHYPQYGPQPPSTPAASYRPHYPSPVSAQGPPQHGGFFQQRGPYQEQESPQGVGYGGPMNPSAPAPPSSNQQWPQHSPQNVTDDSRRASSDLNDGLQPVSVKSGNTTELPIEADSHDALEDLDIPDVPIYRQEATDWHPPILVVRPFASDYFAEEVIATLPPPLKAKGSSISKYVVASDCQKLIQSVRETSDWASFKDDPVFQKIADDGPSIPIDYRRARHVRSEHEEPTKEPEMEDGEFSREADAASGQRAHKDGHRWSVMDNLEQALNSRDMSTAAKERHLTQVVSTDVARVESRRQVDDNDENMSGRPYLPGLKIEGNNKSMDQIASSRSGSTESLGDRDHPVPRQRDSHKSPTSMDGVQGRGSPPSRRRSRDDSHHVLTKRRYSRRISSGDHELAATKRSPSEQNTSLPRPGRGKAMTQDDLNMSPPSSDSSPDQKPAVHGRHPSHNGHGRHGSNGHATSPPIFRTERSNPRKREFDHRESSEEPEKERRRQADDVTPKLKRRQPKVAEAYSRRW